MIEDRNQFEFDYLRREIEVRIWRETIFKAVEALNTKASLADEIKKNDNAINFIGDYFKDVHKSDWEGVVNKFKERSKSLNDT